MSPMGNGGGAVEADETCIGRLQGQRCVVEALLKNTVSHWLNAAANIWLASRIEAYP